ncbi:MAG: hypothetical protein GXY44_06930 [Phycisphaerales bacterium]|nr:hypothetical protein [Phycisphaerales bacterium]
MSSWFRRWLLVLFLIAAFFRVGYVTARYAGEHRWNALNYPDEQAYVLATQSLAEGHGLVDEFGYRATYMPGYPFFLLLFHSLPGWLFWARLAQALIGASAAPMTALLAWFWIRLAKDTKSEMPCRIGKDWVAVLAGLAVAADPFLIFFTGLLLTETLFTFMLVAAWLLILPMHNARIGVTLRQALIAGLMLLGCIFVRPSTLVMVPLIAFIIALFRRFDRDGVIAAAAILFVVIIGLTPWGYRNRVIIGEWRWLTTRGGVSLYDGLQPGASGASDLAHTKEFPELRGLGEIEWDSWFRQKALDTVRRDPGTVLRLAAVKFARTWSPWPNVEQYRRGPIAWLSAVWILASLASAAAGWWHYRHQVRGWVLLLLPVITITLLHTIFVGSVRYRVPLMPLVYVLSASGLMAWLRWYGIRRQDSESAHDQGIAL